MLNRLRQIRHCKPGWHWQPQKTHLPGKTGKAEQGKDTIQQKNIRLSKQIQERWLKLNQNVEKGTVSVGACAYQRDAVKTADFLLQIRQDMVEEYPVLNWRGNFAKEVVKQFKKDYRKTEKAIGNFVSETDIPFVSDFYREFCGMRKKGEKSTAASKLGAFCRGFVVKGAGGTAEGIVKIVRDPLEAAAGVTQILGYPEENHPGSRRTVRKTGRYVTRHPKWTKPDDGGRQPVYAGGSIDKAGDANRAETWYHKSNVMKLEGNTGGGVRIWILIWQEALYFNT